MREPVPPSLPRLFRAFLGIGMQSFGGGLSGWMRREVVERRGWLEERQFLAGLALAQVAPGANAVNLAVFIGTTLRGAPGALAALAGIMGLPIVLILAVGAFFFSHHALPRVEAALAGLGAAAIGLTFATGWRMTRRGVRGARSVAVMLAVAAAIGVLRLPLPLVLAAAVPVSLVVLGGEP